MAITKKEKGIYMLEDGAIHGIFEIVCSKCDKESNTDGDDIIQAAEHFYDNGWRATEKNVYCKSCAKKFRVK